MSERSTLSVRVAPHIQAGREEDVIVEVNRDGQVVATIYGSREGIHIVSDRLAPTTTNTPFRINLPEKVSPAPSFVVPLLAKEEVCPWCKGERMLPPPMMDREDMVPCPVCRWDVTEIS